MIEKVININFKLSTRYIYILLRNTAQRLVKEQGKEQKEKTKKKRKEIRLNLNFCRNGN
jgi:uncharacterized membrane protein